MSRSNSVVAFALSLCRGFICIVMSNAIACSPPSPNDAPHLPATTDTTSECKRPKVPAELGTPADRSLIRRAQDLRIPGEPGRGADNTDVGHFAFKSLTIRSECQSARSDARLLSHATFAELVDNTRMKLESSSEGGRGLLKRVAFVRYGLPELRAAVDGEELGALFIAIAMSKQHVWVRQAALASLFGLHLWEACDLGDLGSEYYLYYTAEPHPSCNCPSRFGSPAEVQYKELFAYLLTDHEAHECSSIVVECMRLVLAPGEEVPSTWSALPSEIVSFAVRRNNRSSGDVAGLLVRSRTDAAVVILTAIITDPNAGESGALLRALAELEVSTALPDRVFECLSSLQLDRKYQREQESIRRILRTWR